MTDADLVRKKLAAIETYLRDLRSKADLDAFQSDVKEQRFVLLTLQLAVQAAVDVASHVVSDDRLGEPQTNRELFTLLAGEGWIEPDLAGTLRDMASFRNVLVHGYATVDLGIVEDVVRNHLGDLDAFVAAVRSRL